MASELTESKADFLIGKEWKLRSQDFSSLPLNYHLQSVRFELC